MTDWLVAPGSAPFAIALVVMLGLTLVEMVALVTGVGLNDLVDEYVVPHTNIEALGDTSAGLDVTSPAEGTTVMGRLLAWLYVGRVPVLMILIVFLSVFAMTGLTLQLVLRATVGSALPAVIAAPLVWLVSLPLVRACTVGLARVMPRDETTAVNPATFVGRTAQVIGGTASADMPAQARLVDAFGTTHYLLVQPEDAGDVLPMGSQVLLVRSIDGGRFAAITNTNAALVDKDN